MILEVGGVYEWTGSSSWCAILVIRRDVKEPRGVYSGNYWGCNLNYGNDPELVEALLLDVSTPAITLDRLRAGCLLKTSDELEPEARVLGAWSRIA